MGLFDFLRGAPPVRLWTAEDDPVIARLRRAEELGDWQEVARFLSGLSLTDERAYCVNTLSNSRAPLWFFESWVKAEPERADAWLSRGCRYVDWAWEARGEGTADTVEEDGWPLFFERLQRAWSDFDTAAELAPNDPLPHAEQIGCAIGLQMGDEAASACFEEVTRRDQECWAAHSRMLAQKCKKWGGSHDEMFEFARSTSAASPDGSGLHALIAEAHFERWLYRFAFEGDKESSGRYWDDPQVREELVAAHRQSLGSDRFRGGAWDLPRRNMFACLLALAGAHSEAASEFDKIGNTPDEWPWQFFGKPLQAYARLRKGSFKHRQ
ncbi:MAG: hypothetical protein WED34_01150 [Planctomycetales bacterium]